MEERLAVLETSLEFIKKDLMEIKREVIRHAKDDNQMHAEMKSLMELSHEKIESNLNSYLEKFDAKIENSLKNINTKIQANFTEINTIKLKWAKVSGALITVGTVVGWLADKAWAYFTLK